MLPKAFIDGLWKRAITVKPIPEWKEFLGRNPKENRLFENVAIRHPGELPDKKKGK